MTTLAALHCHTEFSPRDGLLRVEELPRLAAQLGWSAVSITDHGGIEGAVRFVDACRAVGIKPVVGCEFYASVPGAQKLGHLTVLAKNAGGFQSILKAITLAHKLGWDGKKRRAAVPVRSLLGFDDIIIMSGCASGAFWVDPSGKLAEEFNEKFGEDLYFEVQPLFDWPEQEKINRASIETARKLGRKIVGTFDAHFGTPDEVQYHQALLAVASGVPVGAANAWKFSTVLNYVMSPEELQANLSATGLAEAEARDAVCNSAEIFAKIEDWNWNQLLPPGLPPVDGNLRKTVQTGAVLKKIPLSDTVYAERLERELSTFEAAGLGHYLLLVRECVELFRREGACVGPRGSVGGSLVAYCLGLAELDPVKHDLPWERFYAPGRRGWPDVDIDLDDEFREKVPEILRRRFGEDNVAQISTYGTFGVRQAIRDAARAYGIVVDEPTDWNRDDSQGGIEDVPAGRQLAERSPKAAEFAKLLIGRVRQFGLHPGGFVIQATPITETRGAIVNRKIPALCWDMEATEKLGFVKLDFLGNSSLRVLKAISQIPSVKWDSIDLDDKIILQDFASGRTAGVPQFGTAGIRVFVEMLRPQNFKELVWANAAFRPGGLGTMGPRELVAAYRRDPDSVLVYQEDVMDLCVGLAGFSWTDADAVRKAIAKSQGQEALEEWREKFVTGCAQTGSLGRKDAESLWTTICNGFPRYAFPKAHAAAYAWNAYRVAWAKRYHAVYAFAALLNADPDSAEQLIDEAEEFGVEILPPHVDRSGLEWQVEEGKLRAPLTRLPNADLRVAKAILLRREKGGEFRTEEQLRARCKTVKIPEEVYAYGFGRSEIQFQSAVEDPQTQGVRDLARKIRECDQCDFRANCRAPVPPEWGRTNILIVGEAPGWKEDRYGKPFIGDSGQLLTSILEESGISREDVTWTNVVKCRPVGVPPGDEGWAENCPWITEEIARLQPPLALAVGRHAWHRLGGEGGILKANATVRSGLPVVVACVHPAAVLRDPSLLPEMERALRKFSRIYKICLKSRGGA